MKRVSIFFIIALAITIIAGCKAEQITKSQLSKEIDSINIATMHEGVFYLGSDSEFHHFVSKFKLSPSRHLVVQREAFDIPREFKVTQNPNLWLPLLSVRQGESLPGYKIIFLENNRKYLIKSSP